MPQSMVDLKFQSMSSNPFLAKWQVDVATDAVMNPEDRQLTVEMAMERILLILPNYPAENNWAKRSGHKAAINSTTIDPESGGAPKNQLPRGDTQVGWRTDNSGGKDPRFYARDRPFRGGDSRGGRGGRAGRSGRSSGGGRTDGGNFNKYGPTAESNSAGGESGTKCNRCAMTNHLSKDCVANWCRNCKCSLPLGGYHDSRACIAAERPFSATTGKKRKLDGRG